jgi:hypothetical protein
MASRREVLLGAASIPIAAALADAPLSVGALRILAMTATPAEVWKGLEHEYSEDTGRIVAFGTETYRILHDLMARGLVAFTETPWREDMARFATATPAGVEVLRRVGVEVTAPCSS